MKHKGGMKEAGGKSKHISHTVHKDGHAKKTHEGMIQSPLAKTPKY